MDATEAIKGFKDFFEAEYNTTLASKEARNCNHMVVDYRKLCKYNVDLAMELHEEPEEILKAASLAAKDIASDLPDEFFVRIKNVAKDAKLPISHIRVKHISKFLTVEGMIKQKSDVRGNITATKYECPSCGSVLNVLQLDERKYKEPTKCGCGRKGHFQELSRERVDVYSMMIEEPADQAMGATKLAKVKILCRAELFGYFENC